MLAFVFSEDPAVTQTKLLALYDSVGWAACTKDADGLLRVVRQSAFVVAARSDDDELIGLVRAISDDVST